MTSVETSASSATAAQLAEKIRSKTARVGVVGLGYVGLPLAVEYADAGFGVTGIDLSEEQSRARQRRRFLHRRCSVVRPRAHHCERQALRDYRFFRDPQSRHDQYRGADAAA